ncbi:MAG: trehalose hydrolase, partial [Phycisphaerae bacterium]|nr:trehalose hydrolase [Phycisphaerae bacterium]
HEKVLRFFPVWPKETDARFGNLRTVGAFLVSSALKDGRVRYVFIESEKGRDCTVQNPWPGEAVTLSRNNKKAEMLNGNRFTFKTAKGERFALVPKK